MKTLTKIGIFSLIISGFLAVVAVPATALAATPFLSITSLGNNLAQISITNANPYSQVSLYEEQQGSSLWTVINNLGTTDGNGNFDQQTGLGANITNSSMTAYVVVGGLQSNTVTVNYYSTGGCGSYYAYNNNCGGTLALSQTSLSLYSGQSAIITATNNISGSLYVSSNSNSGVATYSISGSQITVYGNGSGSTTLDVCSNNGCVPVYVTVNGNGCSYNCGTGLSLNQTSVSMTVGQTTTVTVQNNYGSLYISNNSNQSVVSSSVSGNVVSLYGLSAGSATISICSNSFSQCASLYVTVSGSIYGNGTVTFSQSNPTLAISQSLTIYVYGNSSYANSFYVSNNSGNNSVVASLSGNVLTLTGYNAGSSTITVCQQTGGGCGTLYVTVGGGANYGSITFSQNNLVLTAGQTSTVFIYGNGGGYYVTGNSNGSVASASVNNNVLTIVGVGNGSTVFTVCQNNNGGCGSLSVSVSGSSYYGNGTVIFSQNNIGLSTGQSMNVTVYGNAPFYISSNLNPSAVSATVSGNIMTLYGAGYSNTSDSIVVCSNGAYYGSGAYGGCGTLYVSVNGSGYNYGGGVVTLSQNSVSVGVGQTVSVSVYGSGPFYLSANGSSNVASGVMTGNTLNISGSNPGSATITVCQNGSSGCASVAVTVTGNNTCTYNCGGSGVLGASVYANGQLISVNGTVYIVYQNTLTAFANAPAFLGLGFSFSNVYPVSYPSGMTTSSYVISTAYGAHPWGSWIKSGATVYFVSSSGLIPVPDWGTFLSNAGVASLIVPANNWDFQLPQLSPMTYSDSRVR